MTKKSIFNLDENIAAALSYLFMFFSGIVVLALETENKFVRFHALQSTIWFLFLFIVRMVLNVLSNIIIIGGLFSLMSSIVWLILVGSIIFLMFMAFKGSMFKLPIIGDVVWTQVNK